MLPLLKKLRKKAISHHKSPSFNIYKAFTTSKPQKNMALPDPDENELGSAYLLNNWLCDTIDLPI
jgi:hypothetical protein